MKTALETCWQDGRAALNGWLSLPSPAAAEIVAAHGFESITIDMQHGLIGYESALAMLQAMQSSQATPMVRVPVLEAGIIGKVLDAGALGIIGPMINTAQDAAHLVRACRYPPEGARSYGPMRAALRYGPGYVPEANRAIAVFAMIETTEAYENVAEIAATPGMDGLYIGPSDLGLSFGYPPRFDHGDAEMRERLRRICTAAKSAGIRAGIHCGTTEYARAMIDEGFDLVTVGSDGRWIAAGAAATLSDMQQTKSKGGSYADY